VGEGGFTMAGSRSPRRATVLFVDDEPAVLEGVRQVLRRHPFNIVTAGSAASALRMLNVAGIDVVVSDERMPEMTGSEFLSIVCERYPATMRIILTGQATVDSAIRAINEGEIFRFLLKPCHAQDLAQTILSALEVQSLRREASRLLAEARERGAVLKELERCHPGITKVARKADGTILPRRSLPVESLLKEICEEIGEGGDEDDQGASSQEERGAA
jgi:two-component system, probable response regulator PhcQ